MLYRLHILTGPCRGQQITVEPAPMIVGQGADCNLVIPDPEMALQHAVFEHRWDGLFVHELGAMGRVLVNRREMHEAKLKHGDLVELGRTRLLIQAVVQADAPGHARLVRERRRARLLMLLTVLAVVLVVSFLRSRLGLMPQQAVTPAVPAVGLVKLLPPPVTAPSQPVPIPPSSAEELRRLREELEVVRESVKLWAAQTQAPPASVAAPLPPVMQPVEKPSTQTAVRRPPAVAKPLAFQRDKVAERPVVRLISTEQQRLPEHAEFDEMRLLHITFAPVSTKLPLPGEVSIKTEFFDEDVYTGSITPTEALCPRGLLHPEAWVGTAPVTLTASYAVPLGMRNRQLLAGRKLRFLGYRVRLYVVDALQAEVLHPRWLWEGSP